jgi:hypothetical protein
MGTGSRSATGASSVMRGKVAPMRRLMALGLWLAGCGASEVDGFWRADAERTLTFDGGRYEAGEPDLVGICREVGAFEVHDGNIALQAESKMCPGAPRALGWKSDELWRADLMLVYRRADPRLRFIPVPPL